MIFPAQLELYLCIFLRPERFISMEMICFVNSNLQNLYLKTYRRILSTRSLKKGNK
jgi:hypothetical protein